MKMPKGLDFKYASSVTLGGIAMQGVRRADLRFGEYGLVIGAGILGLLSIQMLRIAGVRVAAADLDEDRLVLANEFGAELSINPEKENMVQQIESWTSGTWSDAVIFTAATKAMSRYRSHLNLVRKKGRVVLVGVSGMDIKRGDIYEKELDFLISTSYGPGRYDTEYEEKGKDYPYSYVRWTENRNMTEYLRLLVEGRINLDKMISNIYQIEQVEEAFNSLQAVEKPIMVILDYGEVKPLDFDKYEKHERKIILSAKPLNKEIINVALVGAGNFATGTHLPNLQKLKNKYGLYAIVNRSGHKAKAVAEQYGAKIATSNFQDILDDDKVDLILISTRHDSHAELTLKALQKGKHVFVEKPLATTKEDFKKIEAFYSKHTENQPSFDGRLQPAF